jgi:Fe2+ or Zn2+ uptake regulation protein
VQHELPSLARATVYNALADLAEAGLLQVIEGEGARLYDPNLDPNHHHFHCRRCGGIYDVDVEGELGISGDEEFTVDRRTVMFTGLCPRCAED